MALTLALGVVGTATGIGSLIWQFITWRQSGPRVIVEAELAVGDENRWTLQVTARNIGRSPISITGIRIEDPKGGPVRSNWAGMGFGRIPMPCRLEQGTAEHWSAWAYKGESKNGLIAAVSLADGKTVCAMAPPPTEILFALEKINNSLKEKGFTINPNMQKEGS